MGTVGWFVCEKLADALTAHSREAAETMKKTRKEVGEL